MSEVKDPILNTLGRVPSGLFIVTSADGERKAGFLASFVQQASFEPLLFSVAMQKDRYPYELMQASKRFAINIIPEHDNALIKAFVKGHGPDEDPFQDIEFEILEDVPVLKHALGGVVCEVVEEIEPGDHVIVFGKPIAGKMWDENLKPKIHIRKSAGHY